MTTDTRPKEVAVEFPVGERTCVVGGMAKGAGMIAPNMATMLAFFTTDAAVAPALLRRALVEAVGDSLNRITVDGDTSTNDMAVVLASGHAARLRHRPRGPRLRRLPPRAHRGGPRSSRACSSATARARRASPRCASRGRERAGDADRVARTVAESPLVKTALHGGDPNWGRILAAVGRSGVPLDVEPGLDLHRGRCGRAGRRRARLRRGAGRGGACGRTRCGSACAWARARPAGWMWTCDLSHGYVDINAHYRS